MKIDSDLLLIPLALVEVVKPPREAHIFLYLEVDISRYNL